MTATSSTMFPLGSAAPDFRLQAVNRDDEISLSDYRDFPGLLVMFICTHCPFVIHVRRELAALAREYQEKGMGVVAIAANDEKTYPQDGPAGMAREAGESSYTFPYLFDATQEVAKAYGAACTPDFFLFDKNLRLAYRGQFDSSRPGSGLPATGDDLRAACDAVLAGKRPIDDQRPSVGCNIKWKPGNAPDYFGS